MGENYSFDGLSKIVTTEFNLIAPYLFKSSQILYIRDNKALTIDGVIPAGNTFFPTESMIAVNDWKNIDLTELKAVISHELHHMGRWQNAGYGNTLGGAITSEGIATYYEKLRTGRTPLWANVDIPQQAWKDVIKDWNSTNYNHYNWFFEGQYGKWAGYSIGYSLASRQFQTFDLEKSLKLDDIIFLELAKSRSNTTLA